MKRTTKVRISLLLVVCMLLSGLPNAVSVAATEADKPLTSLITESTPTETLAVSKETAVMEEIPVLQLDADCQILNHVDPEVFAAGNHIARLPEQETLSSYVFLNADGTQTVYYMDQPVKFEKADGTVVEKNLTLAAATEGYTTTQNDVQLTIPTNPTNGIRLVYDSHQITLIPQGGTLANAAQATDNSVTYPNYYGEGMSLRYTPTLSGVKEDILLDAYSGVNSFTFRLNTGGLNLYQANGRYYLAESKTATERIELGDVISYDAKSKFNIGTMTAQTIMPGQSYMLTLTVDEAFLTDENTIYPVTIDPTLTISYGNNGDDYIVDAPIFEGYPNNNYGAFQYNRVGYVDSSYQSGRTVVKLPVLTSSNIYTSLAAEGITSVKFYVKEATGTSGISVRLYPLVSLTTWTESTVTWNNLGACDSVVVDTQTLTDSAWSAFDITELVKKWKTGFYSGTQGFLMIGANEDSLDKSFCSSEHAKTNYRPYVVMTYDAAISLNYTSTSIVEGGTRTLVATTVPNGQTVTWATSNSSIATVSSSGVVTAKKAGTVTITASMVDTEGITRTATCTVYVYIANGVYHIKNLNSNYYLHVKTGQIDNFSDVYQYSKYSDSISNNYKIRQMWKTYYLGNGRYSIRPMNKLDKGLDVTDGNVDIYNIGTSDTLDSVPSYGEWTISWYSTGYVFKNNGSDSKTMQIENASTLSGATVVASSYSTSVNCRWGLTKISSPPAGVYLYDTSKDAIITTATRAVDVGTTKSLSTLQLSAVAYSGTNISQSFTWYSSNNAIAIVDSNGTVTGVSSGKATITGRVYRNSAYHYVSYTICVGFPSLFSSLINSNVISTDKVDLTDDGLFLTTTPMSTLLGSNGISYIPINSDYSKEWYVYDYFDDWYLFAVNDGTSVSYGLYKMREQETDSDDGNDPGVTISFIGLDSTKITNCFNSASDANKYALYQALTKVTGPGSYETDDVLTGYFANTASDGAYLIAEKSVSFFANRTSSNVIAAPDNFVAIFDEIAEIDELLDNIHLDNDTRLILMQNKADLQRIPNALEAINTAAGTTIFDFDNYTITVQNKNNLTLYEKQAILACFTADVTFNSFAAEVEFHAEAVDDWKSVFDRWYDAAIRADMSIGEEYESGFYDEYYDLNSDIVKGQANAHGEY